MEKMKEVAKQLSNLEVTVNYDKYDYITLTDEEIKVALYYTKRTKAGIINQKEYWKKVNDQPELIKLSFDETFEHYLNLAKKMIPKFELNEYNEPIFNILCEYFLSDEEEKGILLCGPVGCGKTSLMKIFSLNTKSSYQVISCRDVSYEFSVNGFDAIDKYSVEIKTSANKFNQNTYGFCFDDLGTEDIRQHFGNKVNVLQDVILNRYDKTKKGYTHITTNLTLEQIKIIYGERFLSRMKEMFKMITFDLDAKDLRN